MTYKKKISVLLDCKATESLNELVAVNNCSISDIVNIAVITLNHEKQPVIILEKDPILLKIENSVGVDNWCQQRNIDKARLRYVLKSVANGHTVCGFGNTKNKWRDKQDGRLFKTHTAWIAHCLKEDFDITV